MKKYIIIVGVLVLALAGYFIFFNSSEKEIEESMLVKAIKGDLLIEVVTTGELEAKNSQMIFAPPNLRSLGVSQVKISTMAAEGTILKEGDFVASLDPSEIGSKLAELELKYEQKLSELKSAKLDTSLSMRQERENILNLKYAVEENQTEVDQSKYEPPAVQRKAEINLEKAERNYNQSLVNIELKQQQAQAKVFAVQSELMQLQADIDRMNKGLQSLTIKAPQNGMLIYFNSWDGKIKTGSTVNTWNPIIATIPDLSQMISKTYVNEIDISKIKEGQKVTIGVDAFPDKKLEGEVISMANVGQQLDNSDAKVFEVMVAILQQDTIIRPAMTTSNRILIKQLKEVVYIPLECVFYQDSTSFVYVKEGGSFEKKEIKLGASSNEFIEIKAGLKPNEKVSFIAPANEKELKLTLLKK